MLPFLLSSSAPFNRTFVSTVSEPKPNVLRAHTYPFVGTFSVSNVRRDLNPPNEMDDWTFGDYPVLHKHKRKHKRFKREKIPVTNRAPTVSACKWLVFVCGENDWSRNNNTLAKYVNAFGCINYIFYLRHYSTQSGTAFRLHPSYFTLTASSCTPRVLSSPIISVNFSFGPLHSRRPTTLSSPIFLARCFALSTRPNQPSPFNLSFSRLSPNLLTTHVHS